MQQQEMMRQSTIDMPPGATAGMDPFLSGVTDHSRQESTDSGLSMGGTSYSLSHTPEEFLATMDDNMDGVSEGGNLSDMAALDAPDISTLNDNIDSTDDLVPSLQLGDDFSNDILDNMQALIDPSSSKADNVLTWL
ncbi:Uncharacterized protein GBIM_19800 [Gryllus bimaculatus]|nr:Uncharacterized protein GBIM_19800 [Gryllus bimaculatus]